MCFAELALATLSHVQRSAFHELAWATLSHVQRSAFHELAWATLSHVQRSAFHPPNSELAKFRISLGHLESCPKKCISSSKWLVWDFPEARSRAEAF